MGKLLNEKFFSLGAGASVCCRAENTRYGFRHLATLFVNGLVAAQSKACYYNRTWEAYSFQSVLHAVIDKGYDKKAAEKLKKEVDAKELGKPDPFLKTVALAGAIGELFCNNKKDKNAWKKRMLGAVPGIDFPEDFDKLSEEEKEKRLNGALDVIKKPKGEEK